MDREQAKETVKGYLEDYLRGKGINTRQAFRCLSPEHADKNPSMSYDSRRQRCKCFACGVSYDIFDLIGIDYNLTDQGEIFKKAYELYNITIDDNQQSRPAQKKAAPEGKKEEKGEDFRPYFKKCMAARLQDPAQEYLKSRGISDETAARFFLGYDEKFYTFNVDIDGEKTGATWRALIIPTYNSNYVARNIDRPKDPEGKNRYRNKGASLVFNSKALYKAEKPVYIVEGELDAVSVVEAGGEAVGLGSTSNSRQFITILEKKRPVQPLILSLDQDEEGQKTEDKIAQELERLNIPFYRHNIALTYKDANEALIKDREAFIEEVAEGERIQSEALAAAADAEKEAYLQTNAANALQDFINGVNERASTEAIKTGFNNLDAALDGGLYEGLYIIGAISSLGKTTLGLQIIDQIAQQGQDCIIFSMEMGAHELIAKSISRLTFLQAIRKEHAKSTRGIINGSRYKYYTDAEKELITRAEGKYKEYAQNIFIHEGIGDIGVKEVVETVKSHIAITGRKPVVFIDYLQILAPYDPRSTDKQNTDKAVLELKRLARDCKIPVIGISSFNRDNYIQPVNNTSFKESGAIEYSADVLIGLQYNGMDYRGKENDGQRKKRIRQLLKDIEKAAKAGEGQSIQAKILKQRNGSKGQVYFDFYAMFNCFKESSGASEYEWEDEDEIEAPEGDLFTDLKKK